MSEKAVVLSVSVPPWGVAETVMEKTGISKRWLEELVAAHLVRKRKRGENRQARTIYSICDVLEHLEAG